MCANTCHVHLSGIITIYDRELRTVVHLPLQSHDHLSKLIILFELSWCLSFHIRKGAQIVTLLIPAHGLYVIQRRPAAPLFEAAACLSVQFLALRQALHLPDRRFQTATQSRKGPGEFIRPFKGLPNRVPGSASGHSQSGPPCGNVEIRGGGL